MYPDWGSYFTLDWQKSLHQPNIWIERTVKIRVHGRGWKQCKPGWFLARKEKWMVSWPREACQLQVWSPLEAAGEISRAQLERVWGSALGSLDSITQQSVKLSCWRWQRWDNGRGHWTRRKRDYGYSSRHGCWCIYIFTFQKTLHLMVIYLGLL